MTSRGLGDRVRLLNPRDIDALQTLRREALVSHPLAFGASIEEDRTLDRGLTLATLASTVESATLGSFRGEQMIAMVGVYRESARKARHRAQIWGMYVRADDRRKGLGRALLAAAIAHARSWSGVVQLKLSVTEAAREAQGLYESVGFRLWGKEPRALAWQQQYVDELHLVLPLDDDAGQPSVEG